jgi:hypothetical protein
VYGDVVAWRIVAFSACALVGVPATWASDGSNGELSASKQAQPSFSDAWKQITDPGGIRSRLEQAGLQFTFTYQTSWESITSSLILRKYGLDAPFSQRTGTPVTALRI